MMEDGSAVVDLMGRPAIMPEEGMPGGHYDNLVPTIDDGQLQEIGADDNLFMKSINQIKSQDKNGKKLFKEVLIY